MTRPLGGPGPGARRALGWRAVGRRAVGSVRFDRGRVVALVACVLVGTSVFLVDPSPAGPPVVVTHRCSASGPQVATGSAIISGAMLPQISAASLEVPVTVEVSTPSAVNPGGILPTTATLDLDLGPVAAEVLESQVKPAVVAAGYPALAATAWVELDLEDLVVSLVLPDELTVTGEVTATATAASVTASATASGVDVVLDHLTVDTRAASEPVRVVVSWTAQDGGAPPPRVLEVLAGPVAYELAVDVGVLFYSSPIVGGTQGPWSCTPGTPAPVLATTEVVTGSVTTGSSSTGPPTSTATSSPSSTSSTSTPATTWPPGPVIPPGACTVSGFDAHGGYLGVQLEATGFFRVQRYEGRWWLVTPAGHPFFSQGVNHVTFAGTPDRFGATPYLDAVTARYGTPEVWAAAQHARFDTWGYNTLGAWSESSLFPGEPYTVLLGLTSQNFASGLMEDLWTPSWEARVRAQIATQAAPRRDDPDLLGYWLDNELHWGPDWRLGHLFDDYLARDAAASPGKAVLVDWLQDRYPDFADFSDDFTTPAGGWDELGAPSTVSGWDAGGEATRAAWVAMVAERYFSFTDAVLTEADPNHLNLGPRMMAQVTGAPVLEAAGRHADVASFNFYALVPELAGPLANADPTYLPTEGSLAAQAEVTGLPVLVSEWSFRAADSGLPNTWPPLFPVLDDQSQRAGAYEQFVGDLLETDHVVGQHWFEHSDEPPAGRSDGEDSNFGLVDLADDPYEELVAVSRTMHDCAYERLVEGPPPTTTTTTEPPSTPSTAEPSSTGPPSTRPSTASTGSPSSLPPAEAIGLRPRFTG